MRRNGATRSQGSAESTCSARHQIYPDPGTCVRSAAPTGLTSTAHEDGRSIAPPPVFPPPRQAVASLSIVRYHTYFLPWSRYLFDTMRSGERERTQVDFACRKYGTIPYHTDFKDQHRKAGTRGCFLVRLLITTIFSIQKYFLVRKPFMIFVISMFDIKGPLGSPSLSVPILPKNV